MMQQPQRHAHAALHLPHRRRVDALDAAAAHPAPWPVHWGRRFEDRQFLMMEQAFNRTGGLTTADEVVRLARATRRECGQPISEVAHWIVERRIVSFPWRGLSLVPMFQFDVADMTLDDATQRVVAELRTAYDDWGLACWFARPNPWLGERAPADAIAREGGAVLEAARADRFVALG